MNLSLSFIFLVLALGLTQLFYVKAQGTRLMDKPNERSMHSIPVIRGGGVVFIGLALLSVPVLSYVTHTPFMSQFVFVLSILLIAGLSFLDDLYHLSVKPRLFVQGIVALLIACFIRPEHLNFGIFLINYPFLISAFVFFAALWAINHFNFMDGIDGFCALQAIFLLFVYSLFFAAQGASFYEGFCLLLVCTLIGFLFFNFPPAKMFMGDVGSATLGLITFCIALIGEQKFQIPILYWFMLNGLFLFDATSTLIRRIIKKEKWSMPHKKHAYQRLRLSGVSVVTLLFGQLQLNGLFFILVYALNEHLVKASFIIPVEFILISLIYYLIEKMVPMYPSDVRA